MEGEQQEWDLVCEVTRWLWHTLAECSVTKGASHRGCGLEMALGGRKF